ncbi:hypothetical protein [Lactobacillus helveticus]|uniref:hypothetical protein n=1 Tax=Lactobacillus helveticus TaxID=1587 RepID=UPI001D11542E|nr:hypothetical protein [Lactobacillus helveticus]
MPASEKLALIIVLPIEATLLNILRHHILEWRIISAREKDVQRHVAHYNLNVKLQTYKPTKNYYDVALTTMAVLEVEKI